MEHTESCLLQAVSSTSSQPWLEDLMLRHTQFLTAEGSTRCACSFKYSMYQHAKPCNGGTAQYHRHICCPNVCCQALRPTAGPFLTRKQVCVNEGLLVQYLEVYKHLHIQLSRNITSVSKIHVFHSVHCILLLPIHTFSTHFKPNNIQ